MSIGRWLRLRRLLKRRKFITRLREANRNIIEGYRALHAAQSYQPICLGGVEDRMDAEDHANGYLRYWGGQQYSFARRLGLSQHEAARYT